MTETQRTILREVELAEDLKMLIKCNEDVKLSKKLLDFIMSLDDNDLVMVETEIYCGTIIWKVDLVTDDYIKQHLFVEDKN